MLYRIFRKNILFTALAAVFFGQCQSAQPEAAPAAQALQAGMPVDTIGPKKDSQKSAGSQGADIAEIATGVPQAAVVHPFSIEYLMGKYNPAGRSDFASFGAPYTDKTGMMLRGETFEAFKKMWAAAQKDGISLKIISATRTFDQQKNIWEGKWSRFARETPAAQARALKILEYSAMPGASRHHWGTDIDLNDLNNSAFEDNGKHRKVYDWLSEHAQEYGFCQPYSPKNAQRPNGYNEEKWHWSYLPLARPLLEQYKQKIADENIAGFRGADTAHSLKIVENYVQGINKACQ